MPDQKLVCVITTIQSPTACVRKLAKRMYAADASLIVMGDKKGPVSFSLRYADFYSWDDQLKLPYEITSLLPAGHYVRKNLGYLEAIRRRAFCIYETDDDNTPAPNWAFRQQHTRAQRVEARSWLNVFRLFSDHIIWPRGFPLELIRDPHTFEHKGLAELDDFDCPIQQGLVDLHPDVDAIGGIIMDKEFQFQKSSSVWLPPGTWCPFNSQSTWWWPDAYPLMYLPSSCSFRMTDIWRSFIAQRCLWEFGCGMVFHAPEVIHERNNHDLLCDFKEEIPGYLNNQRIVDLLSSIPLRQGKTAIMENLLICYDRLVAAEIFDVREIGLVQMWCKDIARLMQ
jgi:hypothetical protein